MKKLFYAVFVAALITIILCSSACSSWQITPVFNTVSASDDTAISVSYSKDGTAWTAVEADTLLFRKRIYSREDGETVFLALKNESAVFVAVWPEISSGKIAPPVGLLYGYAETKETISHWLPLGEEMPKAKILAPGEEIFLTLSVKTEDDVDGVVAPVLGLTMHVSKVDYGFDVTDSSNFVMQTGEEVSEKLPKNVRHLVFSDCAAPNNAVLTDFSLGQNGGVVGWEEDGKYIISTRVPGQKVQANVFSSYLFADLKSLEKIELSMLDTSSTKDFMRFFYGCSMLKEADLSSLDLSSAVRTRSMFNGCKSLASMSVGAWETPQLVDASYMFASTLSLTSLDLSAWELPRIERTTAMFQYSGVTEIFLPDSLRVIGSLFLNHAQNCTAASLKLPSSLTSVGRAHCFYNFGTDRFTAFEIAEECDAAKALDGVLYSKDGSVLLALPKGKTFENGIFEIAEGVTLLGELSFSRNPHVKTVLLPNSYRVKVYVEKNHKDFCDADRSGNLNVGNSLNLAIYIYTGVEAYAVKDDNPVYTVHDGLLYEKGADGGAGTLIAVPVGVSGNIVIPDGVTRIEEEAFWEDADVPFSGITSIHIPASLTEIDEGQLIKLNSLGVMITVAEDNPVFAAGEDGKTLCEIK